MTRKQCNKCGHYKDEIFIYTDRSGENYCSSCKPAIQKQKLEQETLHSMELVLDSLYSTLEAFEEYVGKTGHYRDWNSKRQIYRKVIEDSNDTAEGFEDLFLTDLFTFKTQIRKKSNEFREKIKREFYKWIDAARIDIDCPSEKIKHYVFEFNEVLEGRGDNIVNQTRDLIRGQELTPQEALGMFGQLNHQLNKGREREEVLKGKKWNYDLGNENRINGDEQRGKEAMGRIIQEIASKHDSYDLFSEQKKIRGIQSSGGGGTPPGILPSDKVDKITTEIDNFRRVKKQEIMLIRQGARLNDFKEGKLNFNNNPIYKWNYFKVRQKFEMKNTLSENRFYLDKDYLTDDEISFVIKEFADNPSVWGIEPIQGHKCLIHSSAQGNNNREIGTLIHEKGKFSNQEWAEINEVLELNKQYGIALRKLNREITLEHGETYETLKIWAEELEKKLLINNIRNNADEWEIRKEIVILDFNEGEVLARKTAKINSEGDYDLTGELINRPNELYKKSYFDDKELAEINSIFTSYKIIEKIKQDKGKNNWMSATVNNNEIILNKETALSNNGRSLNANGEYYKSEQFADSEWVKIKDSLRNSQNQQQSVSNLMLSESQKDNRTGKIFGILGIIVILIVGSVVVIRKKLNKKLKNKFTKFQK